jgi:hypothetical protein
MSTRRESKREAQKEARHAAAPKPKRKPKPKVKPKSIIEPTPLTEEEVGKKMDKTYKEPARTRKTEK